jgi:cell division initiation protein
MMNYTPNDLQNITFKKVIAGYNEDAVNEMLDKIIEDYDSYIRENHELKNKISLLSEGLQRYKTMEDSLKNTLVAAQQTGEDIKKNAYEKSENIRKEAEVTAQRMINEANEQVLKIKSEYEKLKKKMQVYRAKTESLLMSQIELLKHSDEEQTLDT